LAELLNVSAPTVTVTLQRMVRDEWIVVDPEKKIHLTQSGLAAASTIIRRHMLTEWMLSKILNLPWSELHGEADKIEHTISKDVERSLQETLSDPNHCPHGNPMPGSESYSDSWSPLSGFHENDQVFIRRIHEFLESDHELMKYLEVHNALPGSIATIIEVLPFNKTITLKIDDQSVILGLDVACNIFVEPVSL
jgi:DtxR family transcriptional regulator, Mn-dependent transcriptional regulator